VLEDIARDRAALQAIGTQVAFVHMQSPAEADRWFARYGLLDVARFSDPTHAIYRAFGLGDGSLRDLGHPRVWRRWLQAALSRGAGMQGSHWRQLTGLFLVRDGRVVAAVRHVNSATRPNYLEFARQGWTD
jgi:hypothetical protein